MRSDWTIRLERRSDTLLRLVSYQLPDGTLIGVLTDRFDLSAANIAQLYKERWKIENWWRWIKGVSKLKNRLLVMRMACKFKLLLL
ncbi:MAG: transposase [Acidobacteriota bacterium]